VSRKANTPEDRLRATALAYAAARAERDQAIRDATEAGMTRRAIAAVVGLSPARVHQIVVGDYTR
jgi:hypothetical protein